MKVISLLFILVLVGGCAKSNNHAQAFSCELAETELQRITGIADAPYHRYVWEISLYDGRKEGVPISARISDEGQNELKKIARNEVCYLHSFLPKKDGLETYFILTTLDGRILLGSRKKPNHFPESTLGAVH